MGWKQGSKEARKVGGRQGQRKKEGKRIKDDIFLKSLYFLAGGDSNPSFSAFETKMKIMARMKKTTGQNWRFNQICWALIAKKPIGPVILTEFNQCLTKPRSN